MKPKPTIGRVRVMDVQLKRGAREEMHLHPAHVLYSDAVMHSPENIGETEAHGILVELRQPAPGGVAMAPLTAFTFVHGLPGQGDSLQAHLLSLTAPTGALPLRASFARRQREGWITLWRPEGK